MNTAALNTGINGSIENRDEIIWIDEISPKENDCEDA